MVEVQMTKAQKVENAYQIPRLDHISVLFVFEKALKYPFL
jgi:hypothetical protein